MNTDDLRLKLTKVIQTEKGKILYVIIMWDLLKNKQMNITK